MRKEARFLVSVGAGDGGISGFPGTKGDGGPTERRACVQIKSFGLHYRIRLPCRPGCSFVPSSTI